MLSCRRAAYSGTGIVSPTSILSDPSHDHVPDRQQNMTPTRSDKHVGLMVESLHGQGARILDGVARWVHTNPGWTVAVFDGEPAELARLARDWQGDGMVCTPFYIDLN